jgi:hypothetical protein
MYDPRVIKKSFRAQNERTTRVIHKANRKLNVLGKYWEEKSRALDLSPQMQEY